MRIQTHRIEFNIFEGKRTIPAHIVYKRSYRGIVGAKGFIGISTGGIGYEEKGYSDPTDFEPFS